MAAMQVSKLEWQHVVGLVEPGAQVLGMAPAQDNVVAYAVGSYVVLYDVRKKRTLQALRSRTSNQQVSCCCWSPSGKYLAAGERGSPASVLLWDVAAGTCTQEFKGHRSSLLALAITGDDRLLASATQGQLCVWEVATGQLLAKQTLQTRPTAVSFTEDGNHIMLAGKKMYRTWQLPSNLLGATNRTLGKPGSGSNVAMTERPAQLKEFKGDSFVDVRTAPAPPNQQPGTNGVYALTSRGMLLMLRATGKTLDKNVDLQVDSAYALGVCSSLVAACCGAGIVRVFACRTLAFQGTLPRLLPKAHESAARQAGGEVAAHLFPAAVGCSFSSSMAQLAVVYSDHNIILWDIRNPAQAVHFAKLAAHNGCIWGVSALRPDPTLAASLPARGSRCVTCAADGLLRVWNLDSDPASGQVNRSLAGVIMVSSHAGAAAVEGQAAGAAQQLRCLAVSPDTCHVAVGDQLGNVKAYDLATSQLVAAQEAHNGEVLTLDYALLADGRCLLASGSRDALIHLYDATGGYQLLETMDDHAAPVTAVKLANEGTCLISCSSDGTIKFRMLGDGRGSDSQVYAEQVVPGSVLYGLALDPLGAVVTSVGQDGWVRRWEVATGQLKEQLGPEAGAGEPIHVSVDPGGVTAITSHSDGAVRMYNLSTGQLAWRAWGHSDMVAAACITPDLQHLVSVGGDGCMIVWRLPEPLVQAMSTAAAQVAVALAKTDSVLAKVEGAEAAVAAAAVATPAPRRKWGPAQDPITPEQAAAAVAAAAAAGELVGESGDGIGPDMPTWIRRAQEGRSILSTTKLPKWARALATPSVDEGSSISSTAGASSSAGASTAVAAGGKWGKQLEDRLVIHNEKGTPVVFKRQGDGRYTREGDVDSCGSPSTPASEQPTPFTSTSRLQVATSAASPSTHPGDATWRLLDAEEDSVVVFDGEDYTQADVAGDGASQDELQGSSSALDVTPAGEEGPTPTPEDTTDGAAALDDVPPAGKTEEPVIRQNLFLQHFQTLQSEPQPGASASSCEAAEAEDRRSSLSTRFIQERSSLRNSQQLQALTIAEAGASRQPSSVAAMEVQEEAASAAEEGFSTPGGAPVGRRWREGKMNDELARMRERLASLQQVYQQQIAGRPPSRQAAPAPAGEAGGGLPAAGLQTATPQQLPAVVPTGTPPAAAAAAAAVPWVPPLPPGPPPAAALAPAADKQSTAVSSQQVEQALPPTPLPFAQPPPAAAPANTPAAAAAVQEPAGPGVTAAVGPDGQSSYTVCWEGAATPSPGPALVPRGAPGSGVLLHNPCFDMTPGSAQAAAAGPVEFGAASFQFNPTPAGTTSPALWVKTAAAAATAPAPADVAGGAATSAPAADTSTVAAATVSVTAAAAAVGVAPPEAEPQTPARDAPAGSSSQGIQQQPASGSPGVLPISPIPLVGLSPGASGSPAPPSTGGTSGDGASPSKPRGRWKRLSRTDSGATSSLTATPGSPRTGVLGLLQRMVAFPGRTKTLDKQGSGASILAALDKQGSTASALADGSTCSTPHGSSSPGGPLHKAGSGVPAAAAAGGEGGGWGQPRSTLGRGDAGAGRGSTYAVSSSLEVAADEVQLQMEDSGISSQAAGLGASQDRAAGTSRSTPQPQQQQQQQQQRPAESPGVAAGSQGRTGEDATGYLPALEELTQCVAKLQLQGEKLTQQLQRAATPPAPGTPASAAGSEGSLPVEARAKVQQALLMQAAKLQQVAAQLGGADMIAAGRPGDPSSPASPFWLGHAPWHSPGSSLLTPGAGQLPAYTPGSPVGSIGSLAAADLENLTARISERVCQQYTDMLMKKLEERKQKDGASV